MPKAIEGLVGIDRLIAARIGKKVGETSRSPYHFSEKLTDSDCRKIRIGDYRVIIEIIEEKKEIWILKLGHRKNIYKK